MDSKKFFNQFYELSNERTYSKSLYQFFTENVRPRIAGDHPKILDLGAGNFSLFEDVLGLKAEVTAVDFSSKAISKTLKSKINYREVNIVEDAVLPESEYDLVFDSHCLNCIVGECEREAAYHNIYSSLKKGGLFASELMVQPVGDEVFMPLKTIKTAMELEQEVLSYGFKILYFMISKDSSFAFQNEGNETNCDVLRLIAQK